MDVGMGFGESSMKLPPSHLTQTTCPTSPGDLVGFVGDIDNKLLGLGIVIKSYMYNSVVRWSNGGEYSSEKNTNLYIIAEGVKNDSKTT